MLCASESFSGFLTNVLYSTLVQRHSHPHAMIVRINFCLPYTWSVIPKRTITPVRNETSSKIKRYCTLLELSSERLLCLFTTPRDLSRRAEHLSAYLLPTPFLLLNSRSTSVFSRLYQCSNLAKVLRQHQWMTTNSSPSPQHRSNP